MSKPVKGSIGNRKGATWVSKLGCTVSAHGQVFDYKLQMASVLFSSEIAACVISH